MKIKIKKTHQSAQMPKYAHIGEDACFDLTAVSKNFDEYGNVVYGTGLAFEIPQGYFGLVFHRSSCCKKQMILSNCVGVIDSGYRGEVSAKFKIVDYGPYIELYEVGDRVAQMCILPINQVEFEEVDELSSSSRCVGGYGSTGR